MTSSATALFNESGGQANGNDPFNGNGNGNGNGGAVAGTTARGGGIGVSLEAERKRREKQEKERKAREKQEKKNKREQEKKKAAAEEVIRTGNEVLPIRTLVRFREDDNDGWRAGRIFRKMKGGRYKVRPQWRLTRREIGTGRLVHVVEAVVVNHSDSFLQRLPEDQLEELIISEFDRLIANRGVELTFALCDKGYVRITTEHNGIWHCDHPVTDGMMIRLGTCLRQSGRNLKHCEVYGCSERHLNLDAKAALLQGIASASIPTVTTLALDEVHEPLLVSFLLHALFSDKTNMLRKLRLDSTAISSLSFLHQLAGSLHLNFSNCEFQDGFWDNLDRFFEMQSGMEQPVLQRLEFHTDAWDYDSFQKILGCLVRHDFLKALSLQPFEGGSLGWLAPGIQQFLRSTKVLQELHLEENEVCDDDLATILQGVTSCSSLNELGLTLQSRDQMKMIFSALEQHAKDNKQGVRVLRLFDGYWEKTIDVPLLLEQLERLPALRHVHLALYNDPEDGAIAGCEKILLDALEHFLSLEIFNWRVLDYYYESWEDLGSDILVSSVDTLCRANRMFNLCIPHLLLLPNPKKEKKEIPLHLWPTILGSVSPKAIALFDLLQAYPKLVDPLNTVGVSVKKD